MATDLATIGKNFNQLVKDHNRFNDEAHRAVKISHETVKMTFLLGFIAVATFIISPNRDAVFLVALYSSALIIPLAAWINLSIAFMALRCSERYYRMLRVDEMAFRRSVECLQAVEKGELERFEKLPDSDGVMMSCYRWVWLNTAVVVLLCVVTFWGVFFMEVEVSNELRDFLWWATYASTVGLFWI